MSEPALLIASLPPLTPGQNVLAQPIGTSLVILGVVCDRQKLDTGSCEISAEREIVLRSGAASLTLTQAGKVILAGEYVLSRSRGVNKIKGGSVQIN